MTSTAAGRALIEAFEDAALPPAPGREPLRHEVVVAWPVVPVEAIRACWLDERVIRASAAPTPLADAHLEAGVFPPRVHQCCDAALGGRLSRAGRLVIPRTSDADYKCFLYLRELERLGDAAALPPMRLFDLLQSSGAAVPAYDAARLRTLVEDLAAHSGHAPTAAELHREIAAANRARAAARRLAALRRPAPRVSGTEAFPMLGAFWLTPPDRYAMLVNEAADGIDARAPLPGPRVLLAGSPVDTTALHVEIESRGAVVVAELTPWSLGAVAPDVREDGDPVAALADAYRASAFSARTPGAAVTSALRDALDHVDAVVFSLPPEDSTFGWDYPAARDLLDARGLAHVCLTGDAVHPLGAADAGRLDRFLAAVVPSEAVPRG